MTASATPGRRERKKAATRRALADAALRLFSERGYDQVGVREVAEAADVSTTTLFKHFPSKEALVFDQAAEQEAGLVDAVRQRLAGQSVIDALRQHVTSDRAVQFEDPARSEAFLALVRGTPELREHARRVFARYEGALAAAIAEAIGKSADDERCAMLAHFVVETVTFAHQRPDPQSVTTAAFDLLEHGWDAVAAVSP